MHSTAAQIFKAMQFLNAFDVKSVMCGKCEANAAVFSSSENLFLRQAAASGIRTSILTERCLEPSDRGLIFVSAFVNPYMQPKVAALLKCLGQIALLGNAGHS